jgi:hypothetical protein
MDRYEIGTLTTRCFPRICTCRSLLTDRLPCLLLSSVRQIGKGSFGSVYLVQRRSDGGQFVMKKMPVSRVPAKEMEAYHNEVRLLSELQHPGIVAYIESFLDQQTAQMCIIMSYCEGGDLAHFLSSRASPSSPSPPSPLPEAEILYHFVQMLLALLFMHDKHILHRDLKTANIFIKNGLIQLGDLGISKALSSSSSFASTCIGTPYYMSPELFKSRPYNHKSDVWALGCVLYEMCAGGRHAFDAASLNGLAAKIMKGGYAGIGSGYSRQTQQLIAAMLQVNPSLRPSVREILCMPPVRRSLRRFVHVVLRHRDFWRDKDVDNFTRQIQRLGMQDMIAEVSSGAAVPPLHPAAAAPLPAAAGGMVVVGVGGRKDVRKALDLLGEEEREKVRMEKKLAELREMQAERERKLRDREKLKDRGERRRSGGKEQQPALPPSQTPAVAAAAAVLERRREEEQRRREEEARRRRERERERERLREWEKEKERQQREAEERRRRQAEQSRERERRQREERERAAVQVRVLQRERESERLQRRLYDEKAEQERQEMERIRSEGEELKRNLQQLQETEEEEQGAAAGSEKERVMQRRDRERKQREAEEMQRLRAARRDYREEKSRALERKEAVEGKRAAAGAGLEEREAEDGDVRSSDAAREDEDDDAAAAAERAAMEAGKLRIEQLTAHLQDYGKRLQTLRTTMQVTALIQESLTEDGDDDEQDEAEAADGEEGEEAEEEAEAAAAHSSLLVSVEERMRALGRECVRVFGKELFVRLYGLIAESRDAGVGEEEIEDGIRQREEGRGAAGAADERWRRWRLVDQLIFMESHCDNAAEEEEQQAIQRY